MARGQVTVGRTGIEAEQAPPLTIAVMDDDTGFHLVLAKRLERVQWERRLISFSASAKRLAASDIDVLIVDLAGLGERRWSWLERLCAAEHEFAIIVCTGVSTVAERVRAIRLGVDDWLTKPCHPEELIARVESVVGHRHEPEPRSVEPIQIGEVEIRRDQYQAFVAGASLNLTRREFQLIELLSDAEGEILERELIYERLWGYEMSRNDRSVDVFVHKLRRKLKDASPDWTYIQTQFRVGYRLVAELNVPEELMEPLELKPKRELPVPLAA
jgi:DNA-binding response OmpR family regulator